MGKELSPKAFVISMVLLLCAGLSFIGGLFYILNKDELLSTMSYTPVSKEPTSFSLEINSPEANILTLDPNIVVSGKTAPLSSIIILNGVTTTGFDANGQGEFYKIITLTEGANNLVINSYDKTGTTKTTTKQIYFTKEKLDE